VNIRDDKVKGKRTVTEKTSAKKVTSRDIRAQERRQQILAVAKTMFAEGGYHATSMRALNKALGVAEALTYHYFPGGKQEILQTIIREGREKRFAEIAGFASLLHDDLPLREALLLAARMGIDLFTADKELLQILIRERNWLRQEDWMVPISTTEPPTHFLLSFFTRRMAQGEIREMDLTFALSQFFSSIIIHFLFKDDAGNADDEHYLEKLVDFTVQLWSP
jgi:AcrR family transcriptional regulator